MENAWRAIAAGIMFHFLAGFITAGMWRLTSAHRILTEKHHYDSNPSDIFSEVMIWPLYLILLFSLLIKSLADLIIYAISKIRKRRIMMKKEKPKTQRNSESIYEKIFKEEHMLSGEAEASYLMRHPELTKAKDQITAKSDKSVCRKSHH